MTDQIEGTAVEMRAAQAAIDVHYGYPAPGRHVGGGRHVAIPREYSPGAPGWTRTHAEPERHPTDAARWALRVDAADAARVGKVLVARAADWTPKRTALAVEEL